MTTDKDGFRHDLMRWVETDNSFQGAVVRTQIFNRPRNGDSALIGEKLDETGHIGYNDPGGFVDCAGVIDRPLARDIILKQMPLLVSSQCEDGGWEENSFVTFRALHTHGFLGPKG